MQKKLHRLLAALLIAALVWASLPARPAYAAGYTVNSLADTTISGDGACTLRKAILAANNTASNDCGTASPADDTITFSVTGTITLLSSSPPPIPSGQGALTIDGGGSITISGNNSVRVFLVDTGADLTLKNLTVANGKASSSNGSGMVNSGTVTLTNVTFSGNSASFEGGGMFNLNNSSPTLTNVTFSGNSAARSGGGMRNIDSNPQIRNTIIWGETGGAISNAAPSNPAISYSDIQGCGGSGSGWSASCSTDGGGNIDPDPQFIASTNLRLSLTSPAIAAGNNTFVPGSVTTDLDGKPRSVDIPAVPDTGSGTPPIVDMGAYETQDTIPPAVTVNQASGQTDPTNTLPIQLIAVFSEPISPATFTAADVILGGTAPGAAVTGITTSDNTTFTITVTVSGDGPVSASIPANAVQDPAGNDNTASTSTDNTVTFGFVVTPTLLYLPLVLR